MLHVEERRRHRRTVEVLPAVLRSMSGRIIFRGRTVDVSPCGIKVIGPPPASVTEGLDVWLELKVADPRTKGVRNRVVKMRGYIRRVTDIGDWKSVIVVILESDFSAGLFGHRS